MFSHDGALYTYAALKPDTTYSIPSTAFAYCTKMQSITISGKDTTIGEFAFYNTPAVLWLREGSIAQEYAINNDLEYQLLEEEIVFSIPQSVKIIEAEAFVGIGADRIIIPDSIVEIAADAFSKGVTIVTPAGSYAETWAIENGYKYEVK